MTYLNYRILHTLVFLAFYTQRIWYNFISNIFFSKLKTSHQPETFFPAGVHCFHLPKKIETRMCVKKVWTIWTWPSLVKNKQTKTLFSRLCFWHTLKDWIFKRKTSISFIKFIEYCITRWFRLWKLVGG